MESVVCTLFEGSYHMGVAGLANSLFKNGFRGSIFVGYKGELPGWCSPTVTTPYDLWHGGTTLTVASDFFLHFLPVNTHYHLTNFKPNFMLQLWDGPAKDADSIAYFDPDIVVKCNWTFFENWMLHGAALVHEIIANDMPPTHPLRMQWKAVISANGKQIKRSLHSYINGGFCGVNKKNIEFLHTWKDIFQTGVENSQLTPGRWRHSYDRNYIFFAQDQDVLNIAAMCSSSPICEMGPEAMDFLQGGTTMSHAAGGKKPWNKHFINSFFNGFPPSTVDKLFWTNSYGPIQCFTKSELRRKKLALKFTSFMGRFYRRG